MSSIFVPEDELQSFSFPLEGREQDQISLVKASSKLPSKEVNRALFFLEKLDGPLCGVAGVEDLPVYQEVEEPSSFS